MKIRGPRALSAEERILSTITKAESGCWEWTGNVHSPDKPYGKLTVGSRVDGNRRTISAHRYSYQTFVGPIPDGMAVCHHCDNPRCVNPKHLFVGTWKDNADDRDAKGRNKVPVGEQNGQAKLTLRAIADAHRLRAVGWTYRQIADRLKVHRTTISMACRGKQWACFPATPIKDKRDE